MDDPAPSRRQQIADRITSLPRYAKIGAGAATLILLGLLIGLLVVSYLAKNATIPADVTSNVSFPVYYPKPMPSGYTYKRGSTKLENRILSFSLQNGSKTITISEQATPPNPPDLSNLPGFKRLDVPNGYGAIGKSVGLNVAVLLTDTTLVTLNTTSGTRAEILKNCALSLRNPQP